MHTDSTKKTSDSRRRTLVPLRFGEYLRERGALSDEQWLDAVAEHYAAGGIFGATVARRGFLSFDEVERLADEYHHGLDERPANPERASAPGKN